MQAGSRMRMQAVVGRLCYNPALESNLTSARASRAEPAGLGVCDLPELSQNNNP